ncbi:MAG: phage holin family protein [Gemmatimonadaceae bacterium]|nr:phage holin family protein [Gemmatimonadaceae bacterium]
MTILLRLLINAAALWCAARFIDGISYSGSWPGLVGVALVFGVVNTFIRPVLRFFSFPITVLTLGLFTLVINALMLMLTAWIAARLDIAFTVRGFVPALLGAVCVSVLSMILGALLISDNERQRDE